MTLTASGIRNSLAALLVSIAVTGCGPWFPCGTPVTSKDCRPFGALQGHREAAPVGPAALSATAPPASAPRWRAPVSPPSA